MDYATPSSNDAALLRLSYSAAADWTNIGEDINFGVELDTDDRLRVRILDANGALLHKEYSGLDTTAPTAATVSKSELDAIVDLTKITKVETWFYGAGTGAWFVGGTSTPQPTAPEMDVTGLGANAIADGETSTSLSAGTDFWQRIGFQWIGFGHLHHHEFGHRHTGPHRHDTRPGHRWRLRVTLR